jgi:hypothetical protein
LGSAAAPQTALGGALPNGCFNPGSAALEPEPHKMRSLEPFRPDGATKKWLHLALMAFSIFAPGWGPPGPRQEREEGGRGEEEGGTEGGLAGP